MNERWTIHQLSELVRTALAETTYDGQPSARVRTVPDLRTIRYYTTLGLLDRPVEMRGRTGLYCQRHLLQLISIKRLQARGLSLVQVQEVLSGADDAALSQLAQLPDDFPSAERLRKLQDSQSTGVELLQEQEQSVPTVDRDTFWTSLPEKSAAEPAPISLEPQTLRRRVNTAVEVHLAPGVKLTLSGVDPEKLDPQRLAKLSGPVAEIVNTLKKIGLCPEDQT